MKDFVCLIGVHRYHKVISCRKYRKGGIYYVSEKGDVVIKECVNCGSQKSFYHPTFRMDY